MLTRKIPNHFSFSRIALAVVGLCFLPLTVSADFLPPETGDRQRGPAIVGDLMITVGTNTDPPDDPTINYTFTGKCKGETVVIAGVDIPFNFDNVDEMTIENIVLPGGAVGIDCAPSGSVDILVNTVIGYTDAGAMKSARVVLLFII